MTAWLLDRFREAGPAPALVADDRTCSYEWLLDRIERARRSFDAERLAPGTVVALLADASPESCALLIALIERQAIIVPTSPAGPDPERLMDIAEVETVVDLGGAAVSRPRPGTSRAPHALVERLRRDQTAGLVLFTSGSTGDPKAALHDFSRLLEKFRTPRAPLRTLAFLLIDHIGGINTLFHVLSNGGAIVSVSRRDPDSICATIARHRVELFPTTPTFLNLMLLSQALGRHDISSLRQITYGTEPMPQSTLDRLHASLPNVRLSQTYGLSELGILRAKSKSSGSLWVQLGGEGMETRVADGTLWIRARSAMLGYLNAPSPFDADGWFNTEDEVEVDGEYMRLKGRRSEIINVGGQKVYPAEVESVLLRMENVKDVLVHGERNPLTGQVVTARFQLESPEPLDVLRRRMREHCRAVLLPFQIPARVEIAEKPQHSARFKKIRLPENAG
jgi:acyl-CoA synthetase (AMP-forming)/AMP-acid ligase II